MNYDISAVIYTYIEILKNPEISDDLKKEVGKWLTHLCVKIVDSGINNQTEI